MPSSSNDHQFQNAQYLQDRKAALIIEENELDNNHSYLIIKNLIKDNDQRISIINNLQKIKSFDTNNLIYKKINLV